MLLALPLATVVVDSIEEPSLEEQLAREFAQQASRESSVDSLFGEPLDGEQAQQSSREASVNSLFGEPLDRELAGQSSREASIDSLWGEPLDRESTTQPAAVLDNPTAASKPAKKIAAPGLALPPASSAIKQSVEKVAALGLALPSVPRAVKSAVEKVVAPSLPKPRQPEVLSLQEQHDRAVAEGLEMSLAAPKSRKRKAEAIIEREQPAQPEQTKPKRQKIHRSHVFLCRFGCAGHWVTAGTLRNHMYTVHNLFEPDKIKHTCKGCGQHFSTATGYDKHIEAGLNPPFCWVNEHPGRDIPFPATRQERADTWAYARDGPMSRALIVALDQYGNMVEEEASAVKEPEMEVVQAAADSGVELTPSPEIAKAVPREVEVVEVVETASAELEARLQKTLEWLDSLPDGPVLVDGQLVARPLPGTSLENAIVVD